MEIHINGEKIDARIEDEKTVGDILKAFEIDCQKQDAAVVGIVAEKVFYIVKIFFQHLVEFFFVNLKIAAHFARTVAAVGACVCGDSQLA